MDGSKINTKFKPKYISFVFISKINRGNVSNNSDKLFSQVTSVTFIDENQFLNENQSFVTYLAASVQFVCMMNTTTSRTAVSTWKTNVFNLKKNRYHSKRMTWLSWACDIYYFWIIRTHSFRSDVRATANCDALVAKIKYKNHFVLSFSYVH